MVKHVVDRGPGPCQIAKFSNTFGKFIAEIKHLKSCRQNLFIYVNNTLLISV